MGIEDSIREWHKFEDSARDFVSYVRMLSRTELELALGRIADRLSERSLATAHYRVRGLLLKAVLDTHREHGQLAQSLRRTGIGRQTKKILGDIAKVEGLRTYQRQLESHETLVADYRTMVELWKATTPWYRRVFGPEPAQPSTPNQALLISAKYAEYMALPEEERILIVATEHPIFPPSSIDESRVRGVVTH